LINRREALVGALIAVAAPIATQAEAATASSWLSYENRLRQRLGDAGGGRFDEGFARALLGEVNGFRASHRMGGYQWDEGLAATARAHAADMAARNYFAHNAPEGFTPFDRASLIARDLAGPVAENLAWRTGGPTARTFEDMWEMSPGHRKNLLKTDCTHAGYGVVRAGGKVFAVGVYAGAQVRLARPMPLKLSSPQELTTMLAGSHPQIQRVAFTRPGENPSTVPAPLSKAPALAPGIWQMRPCKPAANGLFDVLNGPTFFVA